MTAKWENKEVKDLTNNELVMASWTLENMKNFQEKRKNDPKYIKKFENQPEAPINPVFEELVEAITIELKNRNL